MLKTEAQSESEKTGWQDPLPPEPELEPIFKHKKKKLPKERVRKPKN